MKKIFIAFVFFGILVNSNAQLSAFQLYTKDGKKTTYEKMVKSFEDADIVLFGELHNNPICHWLELEVTKTMYAQNKSLLLGAEMFESDDQLVLNEYLNGIIKETHFTTEAKMWNNYKTDYKPLIEFAKDSSLKFIATNIPRRYANLVARKGLESLETIDESAKPFIAPLPIEVNMELDCYKMFLEMGMGHGSEMTSEKMAYSQATKDATMAHFILLNLKEGSKFLHFNGSYHSDNFESIYWYLKKANSNLKIITIATVEQENIGIFDEETKNAGDFILIIPESMTKTY